jgi:hypothetical protein
VGRAVRRRYHRNRLVARLLAGHRRASGPPGRIGYVTDQPDAWLTAIAIGYGVALTHDANPVIQDFVRCCLDNKP